MDESGQVAFRVRDRRRKKWFSIDNHVVDEFGPELGPYGLAAYMCIVREANHTDEQATKLKLRDLARVSGIGETRLRAAIVELELIGLIVVIEWTHPQKGRIENEYIVLEVPDTPDPAWRERARPDRIVMVGDELPPLARRGGPTSGDEAAPPRVANHPPSPGEGPSYSIKNEEKKGSTNQQIEDLQETYGRISRFATVSKSLDQLVRDGLVTIDDVSAVRASFVGRQWLKQAGMA